MEELLVTEQPPNPALPTEFTLVVQDIRQIHERINGLTKQLDSRWGSV